MTERDRQSRPESDPAVEAAIDRAVRELMSVDAPADLRRRVLARLETPAPRAFPWFRLAAGASLAAAVLAVFVLVRSRDAGPRPQERPNERPVAAAQPPEQTSLPSSMRRDRPVSKTVSDGRKRLESPRVVTATATVAEVDLGFEIASLTAIDPITIVPLDPPSIAPAGLSIVPLTPIVEVQVGPLSPSSGRD